MKPKKNYNSKRNFYVGVWEEVLIAEAAKKGFTAIEKLKSQSYQ